MAAVAATSEVCSAERTPALPYAEDHQPVVKPVGGKANVGLALKEFTSTSTSGT